MGKIKNKKKAKSILDRHDDIETGDQSAPSALPSQAMDGHNVAGWTDFQIKAYNELLVERGKLEKQRQELEQRSAKSQTGRALLNDKVSAIDSVFKQQKLNGDYKYTGDNVCCVDIDSDNSCHHEICTRAKTGGLSYAELDTIKYYYMRILAGNSERMRNALRKQRDLELIKLKKDEDHDRARSNQKYVVRSNGLAKGKLSSSEGGSHRQFQFGTEFDSSVLSGATKETQRLVTNILEQLDRLRTELQNGQITSSEMQKKLDIIDAEMQAAHLKTEDIKGSSHQKSIAQHAHTSDPATSTTSLVRDLLAGGTKADAYAKAFHIMESFLSASKPSDFQHAVTELKGVLRLSGPMCKELQGSFDALEGIFDNPDRLSFNGPDGKQECSSIIDLMEKMKDTLDRTGELPEGANANLVKVFQTCIDLEAEGKKLLRDEFETSKGQNHELDIASNLSDIRESIVSKSPIPPLTEKTLEEEVLTLLARHDALKLVTRFEQGMEAGALEGHITSMVMNRARKDPERYIRTINKLATAYVELSGSGQHQAIMDALPNVTAKMESFVTKLAEKRAKELQPQLEASPASPVPASDEEAHGAFDILDRFPKDTAIVATQAVSKFVHQDQKSTAHLALRSLITQHGSSSLWSIWLLFAEGTKFREDYALQEQSRTFEGEVDRILASENGQLGQAVSFLYESGVCPGTCAAIVSEVLCSTSEYDSAKAQKYLQELASFIHDLPESFDKGWAGCFQHLSLAMLQMYVAIHVNATSIFPNLPADELAFSVVAMMTTYICLLKSPEVASDDLKLMEVFLGACLSRDGLQPVDEVVSASKHYQVFARDDRYRCLAIGPCTDHFPRQSTQANTSSDSRLRDGIKLGRPGHQAEALAAKHIHTKGAKTTDNPSRPTSQLQTTIHSPKQIQNSSGGTARDNVSIADALYRAATLYESTSQQARTLMHFPRSNIGRHDSSKMKVEIKIEQLPERPNYGQQNPDHMAQAQDRAVRSASKFSEHTSTSSQGVTINQHVSKRDGRSIDVQITEAIASGQLRPDFHARMVRMMIGNAFSGHFPNPLATYDKGIGPPDRNPWPKETYDVMLKGRQQIQAWIGIPQNYIAWTAKRMRYLLSYGGAYDYPSSQAMLDLARTNFAGFEEYAAFLAREKARVGQPATRIKELCDEIYDLLTAGTLVAGAESMKELSMIAETDWPIRLENFSAVSDGEGNLMVYQIESVKQSANSTASRIGEDQSLSKNGSNMARFQDRQPNALAASHNDSLQKGGQRVLDIHLEKFLSGLQMLDQTRGAITSFTGSSNKQPNQPQVFEDLMGKLTKTKEIVNDVVRIIAEQKDRGSSIRDNGIGDSALNIEQPSLSPQPTSNKATRKQTRQDLKQHRTSRLTK